MNKTVIVAGFIILFVGGLLYTLLPYTTTMHTSYETDTDGHDMRYTTTTTGHNPIGTVMMFIGFTVVVVGLFYKPEAIAPKSPP